MSDDFFNSFGDSPAAAPRPTVRHRGGPPPGPPPPNRGPPRAAAPQARPPPPQQQQQQQRRAAPPPPQQQQQQQQQQRRPVAPPPNQNSYVLSSNSNNSAAGLGRKPPPPAGSAGASMRNGGISSTRGSYRAPQAAPQQSSYYGAQQPQQQHQQQQTPSPAASEASAPPGHQQYETNNDDWYSPTASETMQPSPAYAAAAPAATAAYSNSNNYAVQPQPQPQYSSAAAAGPAYSSNTNSQPAYSLQGSMDLSGRSAGSSGSAGMMMNMMNPNLKTFVPQVGGASVRAAPGDFDDFDNEPPLLEELGVNVEHILLKTKAVVVPFRRFHKGNSALTDPNLIIEDADLAGPLFLLLLLGGELLMSGKLQFGYIYGFGMFGCLAMTVILNLMSPEKAISFWTVTSILGYALLPVNLLAAIKLLFVFYLQGLTKVLAVVAVLWSTTASTRLLELGCGMQAQRYLLAYPIALLYSAFVLITIF